jgi:S-methylmethionine-dependent homocysteine/selenocysteine methylase
MSSSKALQQQQLLNKKLQTLLSSSLKKTAELTVALETKVQTTKFDAMLEEKAEVIHTHTLSNLTQSGATINQVPQWSGSAWIPVTVSTGSSPSNIDGGNAASIPIVGLIYDGGSA